MKLSDHIGRVAAMRGWSPAELKALLFWRERAKNLEAQLDDMLAALEETLEGYLDTEYYGEGTVERARAAIAKAKGK